MNKENLLDVWKKQFENKIESLQNEVKSYENMRKELIEYIEKNSCCMSDDEGGTVYLSSTIWGEDLLNILNKVGDK